MRYKSQENAVFIAIHPTTYRGGGFLAHSVLNVIKIGVAQGWPQEEVLKYAHAINLVLCLKMGMEERQRQWEKVFK